MSALLHFNRKVYDLYCGGNNIGCDGNELNEEGMGLNSQILLVIRFPEVWVLRTISRSLFLAMVILTLPSIGSLLTASSNGRLFEPHVDDMGNFGAPGILPILLSDLLHEGLIRKGQKGFVFSGGIRHTDGNFGFLKGAGVDLIIGAGQQQKDAFDFVCTSSFRRIELFDDVLRDGGLVISPLGNDPISELRLLRNYKILYLRRFENTVVAMRKMEGTLHDRENLPAKQTFCCVSQEEKDAVLMGLEDAYLEPPRGEALAKKSLLTGRKMKLLPDLLKDSLEDYPRRIFVSDDSSALDWFYNNYPTRGQEFEVYDMETASNVDALSARALSQETGISTWLTSNIKRDDYVVMKVEAEVAEKMLRDRTICLVDELFLECKNQWQDGEGSGSKRAYWQCLALYGKIRDEGTAVHQWGNHLT